MTRSRSISNIDDLDSMKEIMIIIHVHALYQTLLSCIQLIFVFLILRYVKKLLESKSDDDSDRVCREMKKIDYSRFVQRSELSLQETENSTLYKLKN